MSTEEEGDKRPADTAEPTDPDQPIREPKDDRFERAGFGQVLARYVGSPPSGTSLVFALVGPWGAGKTSVLHLVEHELEKESIPVVWFNPWLFSGTHQITSQFLKELGAVLGQSDTDVKRVGELVNAYAGLLEVGEALPYVGQFVKAARLLGEAGGKVAAKHAREQQSESIQHARQKVANELAEAGKRIVVFIDDLDRLERDEIRQVFKLVRLVADFPNVSYLLSFDRARVERALQEADGEDGREYLEKIVQSVFDLPDIPPEALRSFLLGELDRCLAERNHGPFHDDAWPDIFVGVVRPLIRTPRDVVRYVNAVAPAVDILGEEVALEDILALEAVRLFLPEVVDALRERLALVTMSDDMASAMRRTHLTEADKQSVEEILAAAGRHRRVIEELLRRVFPPSRFALDSHSYSETAVRRWRRDRRVACREVMEFYLERNVREGGISATLMAELVRSFSDESNVKALLQPLDAGELEVTIGRLEDWVEDLAAADPAPGLRAVIHSADRLRRGRKQMFDFGAELVVTRLVLWVFKNIAAESERVAVATSVLQGTRSFYWRLEVLRALEGGESYPSLLPTDELEAWEARLFSEVQQADAKRLKAERRPDRVMAWAVEKAKKTSASVPVDQWLDDPALVRAILSSALSYEMSQGLGSAALRQEPRLPWPWLANLVGGDAALAQLLEKFVDTSSEDDADERTRAALELSRRFLSGEVEGEVPAGEAESAGTDDG